MTKTTTKCRFAFLILNKLCTVMEHRIFVAIRDVPTRTTALCIHLRQLYAVQSPTFSIFLVLTTIAKTKYCT